MINKSIYSSNKMNWETPDDLFEILNNEFHFTVDVCADKNNAKCEKFYSEDENALLQNWEGVCWMNPPYGRGLSGWIKKAYCSFVENDAVVVCLVPVRSDTKWWHKYAMEGEIRFIDKRIKFKNASNVAPFPAAIVVFSKNVKPDCNSRFVYK